MSRYDQYAILQLVLNPKVRHQKTQSIYKTPNTAVNSNCKKKNKKNQAVKTPIKTLREKKRKAKVIEKTHLNIQQ